MGYNSKKIRAVAKSVEVDQAFLKVRAKNLGKLNRIGESYEQKGTTYFKGAFLQAPSLQ